VRVKVTEKNGSPPDSVKDVSVALVIGEKTQNVALAGKGGVFSGKASLAGATKIHVTLQLSLDGKPRTAHVNIERP
jgi:hypothetical protein